MKRIFQILRITAKLLLVVLPLVFVSGFLTAKPYLLESSNFQLYRTFHTLVVPLVFLPLLYIHSLSGIRLMIQRNNRWNKKWVRWTVGVTWTVILLSLSLLFLVSPPPPEVVELDEALSAPMEDEEPDSEEVADGGAEGTAPVVGDGDDGADANLEEAGSRASDSSPPLDSSIDGDAPSAEKRVETSPPPRRSIKRPKRAVKRTVPPELSPAEPPDAVVSAPTAPPPEKAAPRLSGSTLVRERCAACHGLKTVFDKQLTAGEWRAVISRMRGMGANLSNDEQAAVIRYLVNRAR